MIYLGTFVWILWIAGFVLAEANGFRKYADRWPTVSELVKRWEGEGASFDGGVWIEVGGIASWSWRRWLVACGLPVAAIVLELHWVFQVF